MKIVDNMLLLTWKEDLYCGPAMLVKDADWPHSGKNGVLKKVPTWKQYLAPLQHWFACTFLGHTPFDPSSLSNFQEYTVARIRPPRCPRCFAIIGQCDAGHDPADPFKDHLK